MATLTPSTEIRLLRNIRLTPSYNDTIYWEDSADGTAQELQEAYFKSKTYVTLNNYTFQRNKPNTIRVDCTIQQARTCNYLMFHNSGFFDSSYKWVYAFIIDTNYVNNSVTEITFEIDIIQTYFLHCDLGACWVERQHVADDSLFYHLEPDFLPTSESFARTTWSVGFQNWGVVVWSSQYYDSTDGQWYLPLFEHKKRYAGSLHADFFPLIENVGINGFSINQEAKQNLLDYLENYETAFGVSMDAIKDITLYPTDLYNNNGHISYTGITLPTENTQIILNSSDDTEGGTRRVLNPDNNKLYTYPYHFLTLKATGGGERRFRYEYMNDTTLHIVGAMSPDTTITAFIGDTGYTSNSVYNKFNSVSITNLPKIALSADTFLNWLSNNPYSLVNSLLSLGSQTAQKNAVGAISTTMSTAQNLHNIASNPMTQLSASAGLTELGLGNVAFILEESYADMSTLRTVDSYFTRYGYAINKFRTPDLKTRQRFTYIKTRDAVVYGNNGYNINKKIADILDKGVTFWVNGDRIGNYTFNPTL